MRFLENEMDEASLGGTLVIINCPTQQKDQVDDNPKRGNFVYMHFFSFLVVFD